MTSSMVWGRKRSAKGAWDMATAINGDMASLSDGGMTIKSFEGFFWGSVCKIRWIGCMVGRFPLRYGFWRVASKEEGQWQESWIRFNRGLLMRT